MKRSTKIAFAVTAVLALPALAFAGSSFPGNGVFPGMGLWMGSEMGMKMGMHAPFFANGSGATIPTKIRETLAASGVTLPSDADISSAHATMQKISTAREAFKPTDADTAALKAIRAEAAKKERDYLRSKGVTLPSEEEIAKALATHETMAKAMETFRPSMGSNGKFKQQEGKKDGKKNGKKSGNRERGMMGGGSGMMGGWDR